MQSKILYYLPWILLTVFALLFVLKDCGPSYSNNSTNSNDTVKKIIYRDLIKRDTLLIEVKVKDSVKTKYITRFKEIRHDSLIPCEEKLVICDTVIKVDSALIDQLKHIVKLDSLIISNQNALIYQDSIQIVGLEKQVKKQKRLTRLMSAVCVVLAGVGLVR